MFLTLDDCMLVCDKGLAFVRAAESAVEVAATLLADRYPFLRLAAR